MPWNGDVHQCACSRATSLLLCILRIFRIGPGEPLMDVLVEETKQPAQQNVVCAGARPGGGAPAQPAISSVRSPVSATKRTHQFPGTDQPSGSPVVHSMAFQEGLTNPKHWQDHCHHQAEGQFQNHNCTTIMPPWCGCSSRQFFNTGCLCHTGGDAFSQ